MSYRYIQSLLFISVVCNGMIYAGDPAGQSMPKIQTSSTQFPGFGSLFRSCMRAFVPQRLHMHRPTRNEVIIGAGSIFSLLGLGYVTKKYFYTKPQSTKTSLQNQTIEDESTRQALNAIKLDTPHIEKANNEITSAEDLNEAISFLHSKAKQLICSTSFARQVSMKPESEKVDSNFGKSETKPYCTVTAQKGKVTSFEYITYKMDESNNKYIPHKITFTHNSPIVHTFNAIKLDVIPETDTREIDFKKSLNNIRIFTKYDLPAFSNFPASSDQGKKNNNSLNQGTLRVDIHSGCLYTKYIDLNENLANNVQNLKQEIFNQMPDELKSRCSSPDNIRIICSSKSLNDTNVNQQLKDANYQVIVAFQKNDLPSGTRRVDNVTQTLERPEGTYTRRKEIIQGDGFTIEKNGRCFITSDPEVKKLVEEMQF